MAAVTLRAGMLMRKRRNACKEPQLCRGSESVGPIAGRLRPSAEVKRKNYGRFSSSVGLKVPCWSLRCDPIRVSLSLLSCAVEVKVVPLRAE